MHAAFLRSNPYFNFPMPATAAAAAEAGGGGAGVSAGLGLLGKRLCAGGRRRGTRDLFGLLVSLSRFVVVLFCNLIEYGGKYCSYFLFLWGRKGDRWWVWMNVGFWKIGSRVWWRRR